MIIFKTIFNNTYIVRQNFYGIKINRLDSYIGGGEWCGVKTTTIAPNAHRVLILTQGTQHLALYVALTAPSPQLYIYI